MGKSLKKLIVFGGQKWNFNFEKFEKNFILDFKCNFFILGLVAKTSIEDFFVHSVYLEGL